LSPEIPFISATRRHHAIEHATVAILFRRRGRVISTWGQSDPWGFLLRGRYDVDEIASAVQEALQRLRAGERHLAVTHLCGTNIATAGALAGAAAIIGAGRGAKKDWSRAMSASLIATAASGRVGIALQEHVTTDAVIGETMLRSVRLLTTRPGGTPLHRVTLATP
jgi:hypothetical protein